MRLSSTSNSEFIASQYNTARLHKRRQRLVSCTIPYVGECLLERTLILNRRHSEVGRPAPFLATLNVLTIATMNPLAAGWTLSEHPNYDPRVPLEPSMFCSAVKRSNHLATRPSEYIVCYKMCPLLRAIVAINTSLRKLVFL